MAALLRVLPIMATCTLFASTAVAQINLSWNQCTGLTGASGNRNYACDGSGNGAPFRAVISFFPPVNMSHFVGAQMRIDMDTDMATLPDFWHLGVGECRAGNLTFPTSLAGVGNTTSCLDPWAGAANTGGGFQWTTGIPTVKHARCLFAFARDTEGTLVQGTQYIAGAFLLDSFHDVDMGSGACAGCDVPACLVLNDVELYQTAGSLPDDIFILTTAATRQGITWNGGTVQFGGLCPALIDPVKNRTWGSVKATYR